MSTYKFLTVTAVKRRKVGSSALCVTSELKGLIHPEATSVNET